MTGPKQSAKPGAPAFNACFRGGCSVDPSGRRHFFHHPAVPGADPAGQALVQPRLFGDAGLMILAGVIGAAVIAQQSSGAFRQALEAAGRGETPHAAVLDGMFLMLAGLFLVIPALSPTPWACFCSFRGSALGCAPHFRERPAQLRPTTPETQTQIRGAALPRRSPPTSRCRPVIEGEFERLDERPPRAATIPPRINRAAKARVAALAQHC